MYLVNIFLKTTNYIKENVQISRKDSMVYIIN